MTALGRCRTLAFPLPYCSGRFAVLAAPDALLQEQVGSEHEGDRWHGEDQGSYPAGRSERLVDGMEDVEGDRGGAVSGLVTVHSPAGTADSPRPFTVGESQDDEGAADRPR